MVIETKPICPNANVSWYDGSWICQLNTKVCWMTPEEPCQEYEDYLRELEEK